MSENGDNTGPPCSEEPNNVSEPASPTEAQDPINVSSSAGGASPTVHSSSAPAPAPSSMTLESPQATRQATDGDIASLNGRQQPTPATQVADTKEPLEDFDWDDLEERFCRKMEECAKAEKELEDEFGEWLQVCLGPCLKECGRAFMADVLGERCSKLGVLLLLFMSLTGRISGMPGSVSC